MPMERIGPYRIEAVLGQGGMGEVFLGRDEKLRRPVAIKRIRADLPLGAVERARFRREALAAARLSLLRSSRSTSCWRPRTATAW